MVPPRMYCELCFRPTDAWVRLKDTGRVVTYSVSYVNADASRREGEQPIVVAVIEIEGASPMMGMLHVLGEALVGRAGRGDEGQKRSGSRGARGGAR